MSAGSWVRPSCRSRHAAVEQHVTAVALAAQVRQDAAALPTAYEDGQWMPEQAERELALAMGQWTGSYFRASLPGVEWA
ncbi:hypothetical protein ACFWDQ_38540 [Streptomyces sp. NPDC060053]|uniref:hypothetical protein n=1 Tax=Streptomyces sp. NPDC060053 TaxID=3347047 RepID=UPI0036A679AF